MASVGDCNHLHVCAVSRRFVKAADSSIKPHVLVLSNLDLLRQSLQQLSMLCIYPKPPTGDFNAVVASFEAGLPSLLNHFFPLAGRIATSPNSGLPEVHCNNLGAELVVGEAGVTLASLDYADMTSSLRRVQLPCIEGVALSLQVVSFACGGFTVAWCTHHVLMDGTALGMVVGAWSELARSGTLPAGPRPNHDRSVFRPRAAPSYGATLDKAFTPLDPKRQVNVLTAQLSFVERLYYIEASDIARLREAASRDDGECRTTRLQAVSAYIWKTLASVLGSADTHCCMGWWVDGHQRLAAPELRDAMRNYVGNAVAFAVREASVQDALRMQLPDVAGMVREAIVGQAYDEHFQELVDWVEAHKGERYVETETLGLGRPTVCVTAFAMFTFHTDIGFGRAAMAIGMVAPGSTRRMCSGLVHIVGRTGNDGSWIVSAFVWPQLAMALESDEPRIFKPVRTV